MKKLTKNNTPKKQPGGATPPVVITNIDVRPYNRTPQDIPNWRRAVQNAESRIPRRSLLYDLYADVVQDAHVIAVTGKRFDAVTMANWQFVNKEGKPVDAINQLIDSSGFDDLVAEMLNAKFWGYSIFEPTFYKDVNGSWEMEANLIPRLNYRPEKGIVAYDYTGDEGINIREGIYAKTVMEVGKTNDLGLLVSAAQYAILKRGGIGDYAMFVQVFGRPIIDATWDGFDEAQRVKLLESLNIGPGGVIVRPDGTTVDIKESKITTSTIHKDFKDDMNAEISKALLGTTETTESSESSGYAQSKTHSDQDNNKHTSDINYVRKLLNSRFIKILEAHGFNTEGGTFIIQGEETKLSTKESFEMHKEMATTLGLPIDDDFWYETYGVPKPDNYNKIKADKEAAKASAIKEPKTVEPTKKEPKAKEAEVKLFAKYFKPLLKLFQTAPTETIGATCGNHLTVKLSLEDSISSTEILQRFYSAKGNLAFDPILFAHTVKVLMEGFKRGWDNDFVKLEYAPSFDYNIDDPALLTAYEQNIFRFAGAKTLAQAQLLNELFRKSKSFNEFMEMARAHVELYNKDWLETEYNTAILTGSSAATYHRLMAQTDIFPYWKYTTAGDEHVRHTHQMLEGVILPYSDPRWQKLFPPNGWNCRCYIVPRMKHEFNDSKLATDRAKVDAYLSGPSFAKEKAQGWGVNRGEIGQIFTANQQYVHKFPGMAAKLLNNLQASDFNLLQYSKLKKAATQQAPVLNVSNNTFFDALEQIDGQAVIRDYVKRPLAISPNKNDNSQLLAAMDEAIKKPDEVWLQGEELEQLSYVKYYLDKTIVVQSKISNGRVSIVKWAALKEDKTAINLVRKGLLAYSKK